MTLISSPNVQECSVVIARRTRELLTESQRQIYQDTDRMFAALIVLQWLVGIAVALGISPRSWVGQQSSVHVHVWAALFLGGLIAGGPLLLTVLQPGWALTRHLVAIGQMSSTALLIHLTGGRIESHFQIFGALALLAFYRDWKVLLTATTVITLDHYLRGMYWPQSIFGTPIPGSWRWSEHAAWILFEDVILLLSIRRNHIEMRGVAARCAELESINTHIERKVGERTLQLTSEISARKRQEVELAQARDAALESARLKAEFLATMSHEVRTPMNGIIGMTGLLLDTHLVGEQREFVETIRSCGESLLTVTNDILDFSKIETGKLSFEMQSFELRATVDSVVELLAEQAQQKHLDLVSRVHPDVPSLLCGDPGRLRQVLVNLVGNAIKFTERGGVVLQVILEGETAHSTLVRFCVQDTGIGISEEGCRALFLPFRQADGSMTRKYGGTGLGLAISKQLVLLMHGQIGVESKLKVGSTFFFTARFDKPPASVPGTRRPSSPSQPAGSLAEVRGDAAVPIPTEPASALRPSAHILVAEDNPVTQRLILRQLATLGHRADAVASGVEALEALRRVPYDLVLMDCQMPEMDGLTATRKLRQREQGIRRAHVIALTTHTRKEDREKCLAAGMDDYLGKPIKLEELTRKLDGLMAARRCRGPGPGPGPGP